MSKTILANTDGFTPVIDRLAQEVGLMPAVVFGRIWRFCQMEDGVCKATLEKIAEGLRVDRATIQRNAKILCDAGYLKDLTPDLRNRPHVYADTGKAGLKINISGVAQSNVDNPHVAQRNVTVAQSNADVAQRNTHVAQSYMNKDFKKDSNREIEENLAATAKLFQSYESNIGAITPIIADILKDAMQDFGVDWIIESFEIAAENNKRNWRYCAAILDRWKREGKDEGRKSGKVYSQNKTKERAAVNPQKYVTGEYAEFLAE